MMLRTAIACRETDGADREDPCFLVVATMSSWLADAHTIVSPECQDVCPCLSSIREEGMNGFEKRRKVRAVLFALSSFIYQENRQVPYHTRCRLDHVSLI